MAGCHGLHLSAHVRATRLVRSGAAPYLGSMRLFSFPRRLVVPLVPLVVASCVPLPGARVLARKQVVAKTGESTLIAADGSRCEVSGSHFASIKVGQDVWCVWKDKDRDAGRASPGLH